MGRLDTLPFAKPETSPPLDESFYSLDKQETEFFSTLSGIKDEEELKRHIIAVQKKAYVIYGYPCIRHFAFTRLKISRLPAYPHALRLAKERPGALFLDIGCCFGNDTRKIVLDGWPVENAIASDIQKGFWDYGHELFNSTPQSFPATFLPGNAFDDNFLSSSPPADSSPTVDPHSLTSLNPLKHKLSAIHASSFFHIFEEDQQLDLARRIATLLSPEPGSVIFGTHVSRPEKGNRTEVTLKRSADDQSENRPQQYMFCHSPDSWKELWDGIVFEKGQVKVEAVLKEVSGEKYKSFINEVAPDQKFWIMPWSVTRL
ncbi:hypothetical protein AX16_010119 [Volvariella volvacea WC 439]|nr:hypothetical protein AX16_010119 [Volvariella volvacea WC 439]